MNHAIHEPTMQIWEIHTGSPVREPTPSPGLPGQVADNIDHEVRSSFYCLVKCLRTPENFFGDPVMMPAQRCSLTCRSECGEHVLFITYTVKNPPRVS